MRQSIPDGDCDMVSSDVPLGVFSEEDAALNRPLEGIRVLALEQLQALPYATQLMGRLGAEVVKV